MNARPAAPTADIAMIISPYMIPKPTVIPAAKAPAPTPDPLDEWRPTLEKAIIIPALIITATMM